MNRAQEAKEKTEVAEEEELRKLTQMQATMNLQDTTYTDNSTGEEITVTIPAQCAVSQVEGENTLEDGLVIIDKNGNEWVWIKVPKEITKDSVTSQEIYEALSLYVDHYNNEDYLDEWYEECGLSIDKYNDLKETILKNIKTYGGFFISRYEIGSSEYATENNTTRTPVSKKNMYPYNYVTCPEAQELAEQMSLSSTYSSSLMFGIQWNLICKYIETNSNLEYNQIANDSTLFGNNFMNTFDLNSGSKYSENEVDWVMVNNKYTKEINNSVIVSTGANDSFKMLNIYDLAGNVGEWSLAQYNKSETRKCTIHGSKYNVEGVLAIATSSGFLNTLNACSVGFRATLLGY